jgi:isopenicillin-N N-acyltransferase-like protein
MSLGLYPVISIKGTPYELGYQHGSLARQRIENCISVYRKVFEARGLGWRQVLRAAQEYDCAIREYDADMWEEVKGIAAGAERELAEIVALNARADLLNRTGGIAPECTAVAVTSDVTASNHTLIGQNADMRPGATNSAVILKVEQDGKPDIATFVEAGMIALVGFNSAGLGEVGNLLVSAGVEGRLGVPHPFIRRALLNAETMSEAVGAVLHARRASSSNYMIAHRDGMAIDLEATADDVFYAYGEGGILVHANHFTVAGSSVKDLGKIRSVSTLLRDQRVKERLDNVRGSIDVPDIQEAFRDHFSYPYSVCRHYVGGRDEDDLETTTSIIMDLNEQVMYFTEGPPCEREYKTVRLK